MSMRLKVISAIMGALLLVVVGTGVYGVYSGKMGVSADSIEKMAKEKNLKSSSSGVSISIDDNVAVVSPGQKVYFRARISVPEGYQFTTENNGLFGIYIWNSYPNGGTIVASGTKVVFPGGVTEFSIPWVVPQSGYGSQLYSTFSLIGRLRAQLGIGYGYGYGGNLIGLYTNHWTNISATSAPVVVSTQPASGATNVNTDIRPQATFDQSLNPSLTSFTLKSSNPQESVSGRTTYDNNNKTIIFRPAKKLSKNTQYTAIINRIISPNVAPQEIANWTFTTGK